IAAGATVTLATVNTNFPAGSKVAVLALVHIGVPSTAGSHRLYAAGNVRILKGSTIVSQNQFQVGTYSNLYPAYVGLTYLDASSDANPSYSIQVYNSLGETSRAWGEIIAFRVADGAFLDTNSVALTSGSQVTVGNLTTSLSGEVGVIALAAAENTSTSHVTAFNANDVVLQLNNQATDQIANRREWYIAATGFHDRSGTYALFRVDVGVSNPSYQVKMTARAPRINGEAKILAFTIAVIVAVSDSGVGVETVGVRASVAVSDAGSGLEAVGGSRSVIDAGVEAESIDMAKSVIDVCAGIDHATSGRAVPVDDSGYGAELMSVARGVLDAGSTLETVNTGKETVDSGCGVDVVASPVFSVLVDAGAGAEVSRIIVPQRDSGAGAELVNMAKQALDSMMGLDAIPMVSKGVLDWALGAELVSTAKQVFDACSGIEIIGVTAGIFVTDAGFGSEFADQFLSIFGGVTIDGVETIGRHSIPYKDWARDGLPVQVRRRAVDDKVVLDNDSIGSVIIEWEDKVSDITPGYRFIRVLSAVRVVD
ncbi:MAG: hypothetical protein QXF58_06715, partial [Desulfurococcaceae archaeon]